MNSLRMVYHVYFHLVMSYGLILGGTSFSSSNIFKLQKWIVRILMGGTPIENFFKILNILHLAFHCIFSFAFIMVKNKSLFRLNFDILNFNARNNSISSSNNSPEDVPKGCPQCRYQNILLSYWHKGLVK
jgi:hypothetical protein